MYKVNFSDLWNFFSKENSVEWVYGPWTGSTVLGSWVYGTLIKRGPCTLTWTHKIKT
jgi:hypothetical protein